MRLRLAALTIAASIPCALPASAAQYLPTTPLEDQVTGSPRDCAASGAWQMPLISWGADAVTLFANGGTQTAKGSLVASRGLDLRLKREDDFLKQVRAYEACQSPFLRATLGMVAQAAGVTEADPRTRGVAIYQHSWSEGGDVIVARGGIRRPADLKGQTIVVQAYGPHVDYLLKILDEAGLKPGDVTIKLVRDVTGKGSETPAAAMRDDRTVGAVVVISPDAATLTSGGGGNVGTGAENSVRDAHVLLSTKTGSHIITDLIVVRSDFYEAHKAELSAFAKAMYDASDRLTADAQARNGEWTGVLKSIATTLLDDPSATDDAAGLWGDANVQHRQDNARFFGDINTVRSFDNVSREVQSLLRVGGFVTGTYRLRAADWDWAQQTGVQDVSAAPAPQFDPGAASRVVARITSQNKGGDDTLFSFPVRFQVGQKGFPRDLYASDFDRVSELSSTFAGAVITVEGHADPQAYLNAAEAAKRNPGTGALLLKRTAQAGKNLSIQRAQEVVSAVIAAAAAKGVTLDASQFVTVGLGYDQPVTGMCGDLPCRPKSEAEAAANRVVEFKVLNVEAETDAFATQK